MNEALGLIEIRGLSAAINIMDTMLKVASVELIDIEKTRGSGWMTIKVSGNVGAVNASIEAGTAKAKESNVFVASKVIPRPMGDIVNKFLHKEEKQKKKLDTDRNEIQETSKNKATQDKLAVSEIKAAQINGVEANENPAGSPEKVQVGILKVPDEKNLIVDSKVKSGNATTLQNQDAFEEKNKLGTDNSKKASEKDLKSVETRSKRPAQKKATRTTRTTNEEKKTSSSNNK